MADSISFPTPDQLKALLAVAVQAPSGHNYQPWSFVVKDDLLQIYLEPTDATIYNFDERGSLVAIGGLVESLALAAPNFGFEAHHRFRYSRNEPKEPAAEVRFTRTTQPPVPYAAALTSRMTNRKPYDQRPIQDSVRKDILKTLSPVPTVHAYYVDSPERRASIAHKLTIADALMLAHPEVYAAVFPHVVWTEEEERQRREGLYIRTLELPPPAERMFRFFAQNPTFANVAGKLGFGKFIAAANAQTYSQSGAFIYFTMHELSDWSFFELGRALLRVWTCATHHRLSAQPIGATIFLAARIREERPSIFSLQTQTALMDAEKDLQKLFGATNKEVPGIVMRVGYATPPSASSSRKDPRIQYQ